MDPTLNQILDQALAGDDISPQAGLVLLQQQDQSSLEAIRHTADTLRRRQVGDTVTYVVNRNINYTNICEQHCSFCAFRRDQGQEGGLLAGFCSNSGKSSGCGCPGRYTKSVCRGGLNPYAKINGSSLNYYLKLVDTIKGEFPQVHLHAFSPQEVQFIGREDGLSYRQVLQALHAGRGRFPPRYRSGSAG